VSRTSSDEREYFCTTPWIGVLAVETNKDVTFCPCYLKMRIGNLEESSMQEIWNCEELVELRRSFSQGILPEPCQGQVCPVARGTDQPAR
jgi:radical SAM protein with 4Fe4S-binding SPASM domain